MLPKPVTNAMPRDIARTLSKRAYDFSLSDSVVNLVKNGEKPDPVKFIAKRPSWVTEKIAPQNDADRNKISDISEPKSKDNTNTQNTDPSRQSSESSTCDADSSSQSSAEKLSSGSEHTSTCDNETSTTSDIKPDICDKTDSQIEGSVHADTAEERVDEKMKVPTETSIKLLDGEGIKLRPQEKKKVCMEKTHYMMRPGNFFIENAYIRVQVLAKVLQFGFKEMLIWDQMILCNVSRFVG